MKTKVVFDHEMCRIVLKDNAYVLSIRMRSGQWAMQQPYPGDQRGIIGAMSLALDVLAGKVLLLGVEASTDNKTLPLPQSLSLDSGE